MVKNNYCSSLDHPVAFAGSFTGGGDLMLRRSWGLAMSVVLLTVALSGSVLAGESTSTSFFAAGAYQRTIEGVINVCTSSSDECLSEGTVRVKLFKKQDGVWVKIASKLADNEGGSWYVSFSNAPRAGRCKMTAIYSGTATYSASRGSTRGGCAEENWM